MLGKTEQGGVISSKIIVRLWNNNRISIAVSILLTVAKYQTYNKAKLLLHVY